MSESNDCDLLAGDYNGRLLSQTMLEDGVIHPSDVEKAIAFRELVIQKKAREMVLRLKTPEGEYRWFRMVMTCQSIRDQKPQCVGLLLDVDERMQYQEELHRQAEYDPVSGVYHRANFLKRVQTFLDKERDSACFLFQFDIDRFKLVNKLYGMEEGDKVLRYIGSVMKKLARPGETNSLWDQRVSPCFSILSSHWYCGDRTGVHRFTQWI